MAGGHLVNALHRSTYSTTVKSISAKILQLIAHKANLKILCGNIGNVYVNAFTNKKVYAIAGDEFGKEMRGMVIIIQQVLYVLQTSSERWHSHLLDTLRIFKCTPTR